MTICCCLAYRPGYVNPQLNGMAIIPITRVPLNVAAPEVGRLQTGTGVVDAGNPAKHVCEDPAGVCRFLAAGVIDGPLVQHKCARRRERETGRRARNRSMAPTR